MFVGWDMNYMLFVMLPALLVTAYAQWKVRSAYGKWSRVQNQRGISGIETARAIIQHVGLANVSLESVHGQLTDHYDPRSKTIHLSESSTGSSVAAMAIVAHELGHAEQDMAGSALFRARSALVPAASIGSNLGVWIIIAGLLLKVTSLAWIGVWLFAAAVIFTVITLPVELDASRRARANLERMQLVVSTEDARGVGAVLNAAALTYVAAAFAAVLQLLYWVSRLSGSRSRS